MADSNVTQTAKQSGLQVLIKAMERLLSPLTDATQKDLRKEYFDSLGLKDQDLKQGDTSEMQAFLKKKSDEADALAFLAASKQASDIVRNVVDLIDRNVPRDAQPFERKRLINDLTTGLLNILAIEYFRVHVPFLHNVMMVLFSLNNFGNRGDGATGVTELVKNYGKRWGGSFDLENADEARRLSEVFFMAGTVLAYLFNSSLSEAAAKENINTRLLVGGQFGFEGVRKTELKTPQDFINDLLGRTFEIAISSENSTEKKKNELSATFVMLSKEDGSSGVNVMISDRLMAKNIALSDNWFFSYAAKGEIQFLAGGNSTNSDVDVQNSKLSLAFERLVFDKNIKPEEIIIPTFFTYFQLGFGNLSLQLEASPKDLAFTCVVQLIYAITNMKKDANGKEEEGGFPFKFLPKVKNIVNVPLRLSLKDHFGFDGGFIGERPPDKPASSPTPAAAAKSAVAPKSAAAKSLAPSGAQANGTSAGKVGTFSVALHKDLGPVRFDKLNVGLLTGQGLGVSVTLDFTLKLGPVTISIAGLGSGLSAKERTDEPVQGGFLGYDINPLFVPPTGAGIVVDAKAVKGGGFLRFDEKKGEYFGAVELAISDVLTLNAVGIIRTKDDNGKEMFSLLILITSEFPPISIMGFTLNGVGGLVGIDRATNFQFIQEGLTNNVLDSILFPKNVVANINTIIPNLEKAFPVQKNRFLIGVMAKFGWGTPPQVMADIGVIFDEQITIVGVIRANLPSEKIATLKLKVVFIGKLDLKNQFLFFRADLIESRILSFRLSGTLILGITWGASSVFVFTAGGFNPRFKDIPKIPTLPNAFANIQRIGLHLLDSDNPRLLVETYFAITSNTVQIGGKAELIYDIAFGYNVYGRLEVHALFTFHPFHFIFDITAEIALRDGTDWVMGIRLTGLLEGPGRWHVKGTATIETPWYMPDIDVDLDYSWGSNPPEIPPAVIRVKDLVKAAIADAQNWNSGLVQGNFGHVSFRKEDPNDAAGVPKPQKIKLNPNGILRFSQTVVPLDITLQKFGTQLPDANRFAIKSVKIGTTELKGSDRFDLFAADMFLSLTEDQRLSRPSFERMKSGFEASDTTNALKIGAAQTVAVTGEVSDVSKNQLVDKTQISLKAQMRRVVRTSSATFKSRPSADNKMKRNAFAAFEPVAKGKYVVADKSNLTNVLSQTFGSYAEAAEAIRKQRLADRKNLQVVNQYELV